MNERRVSPELLHRTAWGSPAWDALQSLNIYGLCLVTSLVTSFIWPLALPAYLLFTLITMLVFSLQRWCCPLRVPVTLECADPSQDRVIEGSFFSLWPTLFQYEVILESPANGIFYVGYQRVRDIGRELWLSMDDPTRHIMFFATTGGDKAETISAWAINPLCRARGFTLVGDKVQNDMARAIWYLAKCFGREDNVEVINFMDGRKSHSEIILSGEKTRPQSNTQNPFCYNTEVFTVETVQSMLPQNVQRGEWQSWTIAMSRALVFGTKFWCVRGGKTMSLQMLREHMTLERMAKLYCRDLDDQWPEEVIALLCNYFQDVPDFDLSLVRTSSAWTGEPKEQHTYLSGQLSETFGTFAEASGDIFAEDPGDIDIRDSIHGDRILMVMIPALDTSTHTTPVLGRMSITQKNVIFARDLGYRPEGTDSDALEIRKHRGCLPYLCFLDEIRTYYTDRIAVETAQVRSLNLALILMAQDRERIGGQATAANAAALVQNTGTKSAGRIISEGSTARTLKGAAGEGAKMRMNNLQRQDGISDESWIDNPQISILVESRIDVQELIELHPGEFFSIFRRGTVPSTSFFIPDSKESCSSDPVVISRYISVDAPRLDRPHRLVPRTAQRRILSPESVSAIISILAAKPSRKRRKIRTEPHTIVDTFQQRIAGHQAATVMLEEYDTGINVRESALWKTAVDTLKTTTREERRIRYITLSRPELPETKEENQISVRAEQADTNSLTLPQDDNHLTGRPVNGSYHKKTNRPGWDGMY